MDLVPLIYTALALIATLRYVESANLNLDPTSKPKDEIVENRQKGNSIFIVYIK